MASDAARTVEGVANSVVLVSSLVAIAGIAIVIGPGYLNPLRFGPLFVLIGTVGFFVPGLLGATGGFFLRRERRRWPWRLALLGVAMQFVIAVAGFVAQFFVSPLSLVPLALCYLWASAAAVMLWRLWRVRGAVGSDPRGARGFVVEVAMPADETQIESVREK